MSQPQFKISKLREGEQIISYAFYDLRIKFPEIIFIFEARLEKLGSWKIKGSGTGNRLADMCFGERSNREDADGSALFAAEHFARQYLKNKSLPLEYYKLEEIVNN